MSKKRDRRGRSAGRERAAEITRAKRRAAMAKTTVAAFAATLFATGMVVARHAYAGHAKQPAIPLAAPALWLGVC
jgi:hypothetical protein